MGINENFFDKAMLKLEVGMTQCDFAECYANASNEKKGTSIWDAYRQEGEEAFADRIDQKYHDQVVDEEEYNLFSGFINRLKGNIPQEETLEAKMAKNGNKNSSILKVTEKVPKKIESDGKFYTERKGLEEVSTMTREAIIDELKKYYQVADNVANMSNDTLVALLIEKRKQEICTDEHSNDIDMHIGTFSQGRYGDCHILAQIANMSDEDISRMVEVDNTTQPVTYKVTFPIDHGTAQSVIITEDEIKSGILQVEYNGKTYNLSNFAQGDKTVTLIEMAIVRRFGFNVLNDGLGLKESKRIFTYPNETNPIMQDKNVTEEKLQNIKSGAIIGIGLRPTQKYSDYYESNTGITVSWTLDYGKRRKAILDLEKLGVDTTRLESLNNDEHITEFLDELQLYVNDDFGFVATLNLSDGTTILESHAYSVKGYDAETKTVILNNPHYSNEDICIPLDIAKSFFSIVI